MKKSITKSFNIQDWRNFLAENRANEIETAANGTHYLDKTPLLSFSTFTSWVKKLEMWDIPDIHLENARATGILFMETLEDVFNKKPNFKTYDWPSSQIKYMVLSFLDTLAINKLKIIDVERHITDGRWHGYIDVVVKHTRTQQVGFIEVKTRATDKVNILDKLQVATYAYTVGGVNLSCCYVAVINKKTFKTSIYKASRALKSINVINKFLVALDKEEYKLNQKEVNKTEMKLKTTIKEINGEE